MSNEVTNNSDKESWMNAKWRPAMGWLYMIVCAFDFIIAPVLWSLLNTLTHGSTAQWNPLTLQGAGLFHISMGAVLGIAALGRTQEKLAGANNGGLTLPGLGSNNVVQPQINPATSNPFMSQTPRANLNPFAPSATNPSFAAEFQPTPVSEVSFNASGKKVIPTTPDPVI